MIYIIRQFIGNIDKIQSLSIMHLLTFINCTVITIMTIIMFIIYSKERQKNSSNTHTQHRNKLLIYTITLIYKYIHSRKKTWHKYLTPDRLT